MNTTPNSKNSSETKEVLIVGTGEISNILHHSFDFFPLEFYKKDPITHKYVVNDYVIKLLRKKLYTPISMTPQENKDFLKMYDEYYLDILVSKIDFLELMEWLQSNKNHSDIIHFDSSDIEKEFPTIYIFNIPERYHTIFIIKSEDTDLSRIHNRKGLFNTVKSLYPTTTIINYTTLDMYKLQPRDSSYIEANKEVAIDLSLKEINLIKHVTCDFLDFIKTNSKKYDVIYFFGCTHPSFVLDDKLSYKINLKKCLFEHSKILYSDGWSDKIDSSGYKFKDKTEIYGFEECSKIIKDREDYVSLIVNTIFTKVFFTAKLFYYTMK